MRSKRSFLQKMIISMMAVIIALYEFAILGSVVFASENWRMVSFNIGEDGQFYSAVIEDWIFVNGEKKNRVEIRYKQDKEGATTVVYPYYINIEGIGSKEYDGDETERTNNDINDFAEANGYTIPKQDLKADEVSQEYAQAGNNPGESSHYYNTDAEDTGGYYESAKGGAFTGIGGILMGAVVDLFTGIGDFVTNLLQYTFTGNFPSTAVLNFSDQPFLVNYSKINSQPKEVQEILQTRSNATKVKLPLSNLEKGWLMPKGEDDNVPDDFYVPVTTYSPEQIFAGQVSGLDINFIRPNTFDGQKPSLAAQLQSQIASWYVSLRNLAVVGLLSILVYVGIRIIISSTAADKAKYKQLLMDWIIALCLLFFLHYIMSFTITMVEAICGAIAGTSESGGNTNSVTVILTDDNGSEKYSFGTNLLGMARFSTQFDNSWQRFAYMIMYLALVVYTVMFTLFYLKRAIMMAFLTLIAPLVALTYPIDKMNDGQAQAFNSWLKQYVYNALIQPFHLVLYYILVTSAMQFAATNIFYMIATLGFILSAERILRDFFGFSKAGSTMGALQTVGLATMLGRLTSGRRPRGPEGNRKEVEGDSSIRFQNGTNVSELGDGEGGADSGEGTGRQGQLREAQSPERDGTTGTDNQTPQEAMREADEERYGNANPYLNPNGQAPFNDADPSETNQEYWERFDREHGINPQQEIPGGQGQPQTSQGRTTQVRPNITADNGQSAQTGGVRRGIKNLVNYHTYGLGRKMGRTIKGVAKYGTRKAFRIGLGGIAGAVALASGADMGAAITTYAAGAGLGERLHGGASRLAGAAYTGIPDTFRREVDIFNGNDKLQDAADARQEMKKASNRNYLRDAIIADKGYIPSSFEVTDEMEKYRPYFEKGMNMKEAMKAQKVADKMGISNSTQAAAMYAYAKDRGIDGSILGDDKKREAAMNDLRAQLRESNNGYTDDQIENITRREFNFASRYYNRETLDQRDARQGTTARQEAETTQAVVRETRQRVQQENDLAREEEIRQREEMERMEQEEALAREEQIRQREEAERIEREQALAREEQIRQREETERMQQEAEWARQEDNRRIQARQRRERENALAREEEIRQEEEAERIEQEAAWARESANREKQTRQRKAQQEALTREEQVREQRGRRLQKEAAKARHSAQQETARKVKKGPESKSARRASYDRTRQAEKDTKINGNNEDNK